MPFDKISRIVLGVACCVCFANPSVGNAQTNELTAEKMFANDRVTEVKIKIEKDAWDEIRTQSRSFSDVLGKTLPKKAFTYAKADVTIDGVLIKDVGIRKKGLIGSLNTERPSLKIKFGEYVDQSPVKGLDRLTLNNNNQDPGRICQYLSYKLFRESGSHTPRCGFAAVTINGKYVGIYTNVEPIKSGFLEHSFGDSSGALYEGTVTDFYQDFLGKFESKNKKAKKKYIQAVIDVLDVDEMTDENLAKLDKLVDLESFQKYWAMESLIGFWDSYCSNQNNYYLYRDAKSKQFHFIPWGADAAFTGSSPIPPFIIRPRSVHGKAIIPNMIYRNDKIKESYAATMMSFLDKHWNETELVAEIDRLEALLEDHVEDGNKKFSLTLKQFRRFIKGRRESIMSEFADGNPVLKAQKLAPPYFKEIGIVEATFSTKWYSKDPGKAAEGDEFTISIKVNGNEIELEDGYVHAKTDERDKNNASIVIIGKSKKTGKQIIVGTGLSKTDFLSESSKPKDAGGVLLQPGSLGMMNPKMKMMFGKMEFEDASTTEGEPVKGKLKMTIGEFDFAPKAEPDSESDSKSKE